MQAIYQVLLIEDSPGDVEITRRALLGGRWRFELDWRSRLSEAIDVIETSPPQAILLDLSLPDANETDGLTALIERWPHIPVIVLTGSDNLAQDALRVGAQDYLLKGEFDAQSLQRAICYAIERKQARADLEASRQAHLAVVRLQADMLDALPAAVALLDHNGLVTLINRQWDQNARVDSLQPICPPVGSSFISALASCPALDPHVASRLSYKLSEFIHLPRADFEAELMLNTEPQPHWVRLSARQTQLDRGPGVIVMLNDVTGQKQLERELHQRTHYDSVTGLMNTRSFLHHLAELANRVEPGNPDRPTHVDLFVVTLDWLDDVNQGLGHDEGNAILKTFARRIFHCASPDSIIARLGNEEFGLAIASSLPASQQTAIANCLLAHATTPFQAASGEISLSACVGYAQTPADKLDPDRLLRDARIALRLAQDQGPGSTRLFESRMQDQTVERIGLRNDLQNAVRFGLFSLAFQPILSRFNPDHLRFEALIRWQHPQRGPVSPAQFIPIAEEAGLIGTIGDWVLREASAFATSLQEQIDRPIHVSVNISGLQLVAGDLPQRVDQHLRAAGLKPHQLTLELTETILMADPRLTIKTFDELLELGVRVSIDDFGTGFSSLRYLSELPVSELKIDHAFISRVPVDSGARQIVTAIATLAQSLGLHTVVEGIENEDILSHLDRIPFEFMQGYHFGRPMKPADCSQWASARSQTLASEIRESSK